MLSNDEIPSTNTIGRIVLYLGAMVALGMSFSFSLDLLNKFFAGGLVGIGLTLFGSFVLIRYIAVTHFRNQDS